MLVCRSMRVCVTRSIRCFVHCYSSVYALNCRTRKISVCWTGEKCVSTNKQGSKAQQSNKAKAKRMRKNKLFIQIHKLFPLLRSRVDFDRGNVLLLFLWFDCFFFCVHCSCYNPINFLWNCSLCCSFDFSICSIFIFVKKK